jgi:hypothetical protein
MENSIKEVAAGFSLRNQKKERNLKVAATILSRILFSRFRAFVVSSFVVLRFEFLVLRYLI